MPYHVMARAGRYCVVKDNADGTNTDVPGGCHATKEEATAQLRALYANEPSARATVHVGERFDIGQWILDGADGAIPWGSPGAFTACVDIVGGHVDDPEALCGWAKGQVGSAGTRGPAGPTSLTAAGRRDGQAFVERTAALMAPLEEPYPVPAYPPVEWFAPSEFARSDRLTITEDGRVGGRFYQAGVCIIDGTSDCWEPPPSPSGYSLFHQGDVVTADGELRELYVGAIGNVHGHASAFVDGSTAVAHYADPSAQLVLCRAYDDDAGGYIAGTLVPGATYGDVALLRRSALSGDWRSFKTGDRIAKVAASTDGYDCIGPTLVTRPGLPIIREYRAASVGSSPVYIGGCGGVPEPELEPAAASTQEATAVGVTLQDNDGRQFTIEGVQVVHSAAPHAFVDDNGDGKCDVCGMTEQEHSATSAPAPPFGKGDQPPPAGDKPAPDKASGGVEARVDKLEARLDKLEGMLEELVANARAQVAAQVAALAEPALPALELASSNGV